MPTPNIYSILLYCILLNIIIIIIFLAISQNSVTFPGHTRKTI